MRALCIILLVVSGCQRIKIQEEIDETNKLIEKRKIQIKQIEKIRIINESRKLVTN